MNMKILTILAGVCLLALSLTFTDALEKKQDEDHCMNLAKNALECLTALLSDHQTSVSVCIREDQPIVRKYFGDCDADGGARKKYDAVRDYIEGDNRRRRYVHDSANQ